MRRLCALAIASALPLAACGGGDSGDSPSQTGQHQPQGLAQLQAARQEVLQKISRKYRLRPYQGSENAFRLPNGRWCSIDDVLTGPDVRARTDLLKLTSPDGRVAVIVGYFLVRGRNIPDATLRAGCAQAVKQALGW